MSQYSDNEIISLFKENENSAFTLLVKKYQEKIYWHIRKILLNHNDADDITQNTFIKIFKNLKNFRHESELYTWIYRIATNEALTFLKQKRKRGLFTTIEIEEELINNLKSDDYFDGNELQLKLQKALLKLPKKQRLVFNMKYFDDMKYEDISKILKTSIGSLKASYHHAVKKIENLLDEN